MSITFANSGIAFSGTHWNDYTCLKLANSGVGSISIIFDQIFKKNMTIEITDSVLIVRRAILNPITNIANAISFFLWADAVCLRAPASLVNNYSTFIIYFLSNMVNMSSCVDAISQL